MWFWRQRRRSGHVLGRPVHGTPVRELLGIPDDVKIVAITRWAIPRRSAIRVRAKRLKRSCLENKWNA
jgi:hypothetical protein